MTSKPNLFRLGVIHSYSSGWQGADIVPDPIIPGSVDFIKAAIEHFRIAIFSSRSNQHMGVEAMQFWLKVHLYHEMDAHDADDLLREIEWPKEKPPALITIDDRALTFTGDWTDFSMERLLKFKPWNKR